MSSSVVQEFFLFWLPCQLQKGKEGVLADWVIGKPRKAQNLSCFVIFPEFCISACQILYLLPKMLMGFGCVEQTLCLLVIHYQCFDLMVNPISPAALFLGVLVSWSSPRISAAWLFWGETYICKLANRCSLLTVIDKCDSTHQNWQKHYVKSSIQRQKNLCNMFQGIW